MSETEGSTFDVQQLRRGLRDLAALSALPIIWTESDARRIAESLADALLYMLHLELVYLLVRDRAYETPVEVAHTARGPVPTAQAQEIGRALAPWLNTDDLSRTPISIANPLGNGMTRIICPPFGIKARGGVLVACSPRADFPTEVDRLLLGVAANQMAILLDRRRTEDALRESEERFRGTFENAGSGIADCDVQGRYLRVNQKLCEIVGYTREELLQKTWQDITHPDDLAASLEQFLPFLRGEKPSYSREKRYVRKDGSPVWVDVAVSLGRDAAGTPTYIIAILHDISERKRLEEELSQANARLGLAVRGSNINIYELNMPDGVLENGRWEAVSVGNHNSGIDRSELPTEFAGSMAHVHPDDLERVVRAMRAHLSGETRQYEAEFRVRHRDGSYSWRLTRGVAVRDAEGRAIRFMFSSIDITELKRAEEALRASEQRFRGTFENAAVGIAHTHPEGWFLRVNEKFCAIVGYPRKELLEKTWRDITHPDDLAASIDVSAAALRGESPGLPLEKRYLRKDGSLVWVELFVSPQRDAAGAPGYLIAIIQDISQRKRLEEALRESEKRFRTFVDHATDAFFLQDDQLVVVDVNRQACQSLGYTRDELVGMTPLDFDPDVTPAMLAEIGRTLDVGEVLVFESRHRRKDGSVFPVEVRGRLFWEGGRRLTVAMARDITEHKRAEEALSESERRFRTLAEALPLMVWTAGPDGATDYYNPHTIEYTGLTLEQLRGWEWGATIHPEELPRCLELWTRSIATGEPYEIEFQVRRADGAFRWHLARALAHRDDSGRITKWFGSCMDIDDQKRAQEVLRESERRFRTLAEALPLHVWTTESDGANDYVNARTTEYTGLTQEQFREWNWQSAFHPEDLPRVLELWTRSIATGEPYEIEYRLRRADGAFRWHLARALALRDDSGRITKWFGSNIDIEDQKRAQEALREAKEAAEAANRAKDEFLANVSHEIRTPMNAILGMTELVLDTSLTGDQRQCLRTVQSAADNLLGLMNDLLDFSKIEAGKLELDPADFLLRAAVGDTLHALAMRAHRKGLELVCHVQPDVPDALVGDAGRLRQVLLNLVGNAIKFTDQGEVVVRVEAAGDPAAEDEAGLRFVVSDTGIGISPDQQERIFRAFEQEDTSTTRRYGGTGLGLTIAARLVALMGGTIIVESAPGRGSTFAFTARFGRQPPGSEPVATRPPAQLRDLRVLIVDDNATNRRILEEWLRSWRMEPAAVGDGLTALNALWRAVSAGRPYALVLLDARMPDTDGLALAAKLREQAELAATRIILLTSGDRPGDLVRSREVRVEAHLLKPLQQEELLEAIYRVMSRTNGEANTARPAPAEESTPAPVPAAAPLRILVAEDNEFNKQHLEGLLARRGHKVRLADNGREALALLGMRGQESGATPSPTSGPLPLTTATDPSLRTPAFDLLVLDLQMPELDGLQVVRAIREWERGAGGHLPVIALTARSRKEDRERCLAAGMDDYLAKPVRSAELFAAIERVVSSQKVPQIIQPAASAIERVVSSQKVPQIIRPDAGDGTRLLDPVVVLAACGEEAEGLRRICQGLRSYLPDRLAEVGEALRKRDAARLRVAAHMLCGLLSAFSTVAGGVASDLEDQAAGGRLDESRRLVEQLEVMARELLLQVDGLSIEALRDQAGAAGDRDWTASP